MPRERNEVHTLVMNVTPLLDKAKYDRLYDKMPDFRKAKADRLHFAGDRFRSVGAWYLRMLAGERYGQIEEAACNLSHSGEYALCSVGPAGAKVGCDVEMTKTFREAVARRFFDREEYRHIMKQEEMLRTDWFYRYWVLKESFIKATRRGIAMELDSFRFAFDEEERPYLSRQPGEVAEPYFFKEYAIEGARIAVCSTCERFAESLEICEIVI